MTLHHLPSACNLRDLVVLKKSTARTCRSTVTSCCARSQIAVRKRNVEPERTRPQLVTDDRARIWRASGETEVPSTDTIGEAGDGSICTTLDDVAYVRFASVYRNFREAKGFPGAAIARTGKGDGGRHG